MGPGIFPGRDDLRARGEQGDARRAAHLHGCNARCGEQGDVAGIEAGAGGDELLARLEVDRDRADVRRRTGVEADPKRCAVAARFFLWHHEVRTRRNRRTGEDPHRLSGADCAGIGPSSGRFSDDGQAAGAQIRGSHGEAIHCRGSERRLVPGGARRLAQNAVERSPQRDRLATQRSDRRAHLGPSLIDAVHVAATGMLRRATPLESAA